MGGPILSQARRRGGGGQSPGCQPAASRRRCPPNAPKDERCRRSGSAPAQMSTRSAHPQLTPKTPARQAFRPFGERRDAKQESPFYEMAGAVRRSMTQELLADRKR